MNLTQAPGAGGGEGAQRPATPDVTVRAMPEPSASWLMGVGAAMVGGRRVRTAARPRVR
ncbi:MAG: PEP-CTERM sorting domain-containing protein [Aquabacterium sp.]|nr:MAG: PEP-CTERM sorting domain-containing protein [Aquabacterium sp.]